MPLPQRAKRLYRDSIVRSTTFLTFSLGAVAVGAFLFWVINGRLADVNTIGQATSLVTSSTLVAYLTVFGINGTFVRFLPTAKEPEAMLSSGFAICLVGATVVSLGYVELLPVLAPRLAFVQRSPLYTLEFVVFTTFGALNLLTDSVLLARQQAKYIFWSDGVVQGLVKLLTPVALLILGVYAAFGALGIFAAFGLGVTADVLVSLVLISRRLGYHLQRPNFRDLRERLRYTITNYAVNVLDVLPNLALPVVVLDGLGSRKAGYFYIAFQIAAFFSSVGISIAISSVSAGAQVGARLKDVTRRSRAVLGIAIPPTLLAGLAMVPWALLIFGSSYERNARGAFLVLVLAVPSVALCQWTRALLQISNQLPSLLVSQLIYAGVVLGASVVVVQRGIVWVAAAFLFGNLVAGIVAGLAFSLREQHGLHAATRGPAHRISPSVRPSVE